MGQPPMSDGYFPPPEVPISLVAEPDGVGTTGLIDTGASFDAPAGPPLRCDHAHDIKIALTRCMSSMKLVRVPIPAPDFAGTTIGYSG